MITRMPVGRNPEMHARIGPTHERVPVRSGTNVARCRVKVCP